MGNTEKENPIKREITEIIGTHPKKCEWLKIRVNGAKIPDDIVAATLKPIKVTATRPDGTTLEFTRWMTDDEFRNISFDGFVRME